MEFDEELELGHLLFNERKCRTCHIEKDLLTDFYLIRKNKKGFPSAYSYECKECTKEEFLMQEKRTLTDGSILTGKEFMHGFPL